MVELQKFVVPKPESIEPWVEQVDCLIDNLHGFLGDLPYDPTPQRLYCAVDLYEGFEEGGFENAADQTIYRLAQKAGYPLPGPIEELAQRLHDHGRPSPATSTVLGRTWLV